MTNDASPAHADKLRGETPEPLAKARRRSLRSGDAPVGLPLLAPAGTVPDPNAAAFFDVDNTVMQGSSIYHLARGLAKRKYFTFGEISGFAWKQLKFVLSGTENLDDVASVTESALSFVKGKNVQELQTVGQEILDEILIDKLWPGTLALAQAHLDAGQDVYLISATPVEIGESLAERLGVTGALGTRAEIVDGYYTGRLAGPPMHGQAKADAIEELAAEKGFDLAECAAYSDSANDVPMLSLVGHPCAVNPDKNLRRIARENHWEFVDFRTGRKAAKIGIPSGAAAVGVIGTSVAIGIAIGRRQQRNRTYPQSRFK